VYRPVAVPVHADARPRSGMQNYCMWIGNKLLTYKTQL